MSKTHISDDGDWNDLGPAADECLRALSGANHVVITSHPKPDGDAVGSTLALKRILDGAGKQTRVAGLAPVSRRYLSFVEGYRLETPASAMACRPDLLVVLDAGAIDRIDPEFLKARPQPPIMNIDHHAGNTSFGNVNLVDTAACSTGEIVYRLAVKAGYPLDRDTALLLWLAIVTDTGRFAHGNTTPRSMLTAAKLLQFGLPTEDIDRRVYRSLTPQQLDLRSRATRSLRFHCSGQAAFIFLACSDFTETGCGPEDTEDIIEIPRSMAGFDIAVLFYEHDARTGVKVSTRSNDPYDVSCLCRGFGGGGHPRAAGCTMKCNLDQAQELILTEVAAILHCDVDGE